jgi:hypothetical protein
MKEKLPVKEHECTKVSIGFHNAESKRYELESRGF